VRGVRRYIEMPEGDLMVYKSVVRIRKFLGVERKRVPGTVLFEADRLECQKETSLRVVSGGDAANFTKARSMRGGGRHSGSCNDRLRQRRRVVKHRAVLMFVGVASAAACLLNVSESQAQAQAEKSVRFEVASIRVHSFASGDRGGPPISGNRFMFTGNLNQLIMYAYDLKGGYQLSGGPSWAIHPQTDGDYYDISAKAEGADVLAQSLARQLLQTLLADRFQLRLHREMREMPVYALVVGKAGPKLKESAPDATLRMTASVSVTTVTSIFTKSQMDSLVRVLSGAADRPVLDQTGLTGFYDYKVEFARDPASAESSAPSIFTAVQEQLGLKLEPEKGSIEVLVIDHADRPSEN
jgi:uncharacterized protein (TIGR03435 family)